MMLERRKLWILLAPLVLGTVWALGGESPGTASQQARTSSDPEVVATGLAVGHVDFEQRARVVELLRASRTAQGARIGIWKTRRQQAPFQSSDSLLRIPPSELRGVALPLHSLDPSYDYSREIREIAALGARWISLQVVTLQERVDSSEVPISSERTPPDERIRATIELARQAGLEVLLLPIVLIRDPGPDDWRGTLAPVNRELWWRTYSRFLLHMVDLAGEAGASAVCVGSELASMEKDEARWKLLIANARMRFGGYLTYSANWDHFDEIGFWRQLDFAGMTAYFELHKAPSPTLAQLESGWRHAEAEMQRLARFSHRPVLFTEIGIPSLKGAAGAPWDYTARGECDLEVQRRAFEAFGNVFTRGSESRFLGMLLYDWWGLGGAGDTNYTAREKPAAGVWRELLR